jgi:hypothetical protein
VDALPVLLVLVHLFAIPATHCKGHRAEPRRRDDFTTVDTVSVNALIEMADRVVDSVQNLCLHLNYNKRKIIVRLDFECFCRVR